MCVVVRTSANDLLLWLHQPLQTIIPEIKWTKKFKPGTCCWCPLAVQDRCSRRSCRMWHWRPWSARRKNAAVRSDWWDSEDPLYPEMQNLELWETCVHRENENRNKIRDVLKNFAEKTERVSICPCICWAKIWFTGLWKQPGGASSEFKEWAAGLHRLPHANTNNLYMLLGSTVGMWLMWCGNFIWITQSGTTGITFGLESHFRATLNRNNKSLCYILGSQFEEMSSHGWRESG